MTIHNRRFQFLVLLVLMITSGAFVLMPDRALEATEPERSVRVEVILSERTLEVYTDGSLMNSFEVAIGESDHPTPTGEFTIDRIIWNPDWIPPNEEWAEDETRKEPGDEDNPMQAAKIFFEYPDYYIHGTNAPQTVGDAASHGCLRMRQGDIENLAEFLQKAGGEDRGDAWFERMRSSDTEKTEVTLPDPITITIRS